MKGIAFKDRVRVQITAGNGGDGAVSFRREKFIPFGGPNGGNGGNGGHVFLKADKDLDSLISLYYRPIQKARDGDKGGQNNRTGETGDDLIIPVPCGTVVYELPSGGRKEEELEEYQEEEPVQHIAKYTYSGKNFIGEVVNEGDLLKVAAGGKGGRGNTTFTTSTNRAPREFTPGVEGEHKILLLELKMVAEVGLVGYPNAGKSTLLSKLSHAHPKIAAYPFTTLNPLIGVLAFDDYTTVKIADIPGLIDGAHKGVGLGHDFLRHIERTKLLIMIIDMAAIDGRDPVKDYEGLQRELSLYSDDLPHRPAIIVANKMDMPDSAENLVRFQKETGTSPLSMSAETGEGIEPLKKALYDWKRGLRFIDEAPGTRL